MEYGQGMREERGDVKRGRLNDSLKGRDGWPIRAKGEGERGQRGLFPGHRRLIERK